MNNVFKFNAELFRAASLVKSTEKTRYYLQGVLIQPHPVKGAFLVATDGHRAAVIHDEHATAPRDAILACDWKSPALKVKRGEPGRQIEFAAPERKSTPAAAVVRRMNPPSGEVDPEQIDSLMVHEIDGVLPDWTRVIPIDPPATNEIGAFNADLLRGIADSAKAASFESPRAPFLKFFATGPTDPTIIRCAQTPHAVYVLMPLRWLGAESSPAWLRATPAEKVAAE